MNADDVDALRAAALRAHETSRRTWRQLADLLGNRWAWQDLRRTLLGETRNEDIVRVRAQAVLELAQREEEGIVAEAVKAYEREHGKLSAAERRPLVAMLETVVGCGDVAGLADVVRRLATMPDARRGTALQFIRAALAEPYPKAKRRRRDDGK